MTKDVGEYDSNLQIFVILSMFSGSHNHCPMCSNVSRHPHLSGLLQVSIRMRDEVSGEQVVNFPVDDSVSEFGILISGEIVTAQLSDGSGMSRQYCPPVTCVSE